MTEREKVAIANAVHRALRERFGWVAEGTWGNNPAGRHGDRAVSALAFAASVRDHVKYKPGWRFEAKIPFERDEVMVYAMATVQDVNCPTQTSQVFQARSVPGYLTEHPESWPQIIHHLIVDLEMHEVNEWLFIGGQRLNEPHPK